MEAWVCSVERIAKAAEFQPQAANAAFTKSLQFDWSFLQQVVPHCAEALTPLESMIDDKFLPAGIGGSISEVERVLFSLSTHKGG